MELTPGTQLGPYKIERVLGSGAMGAVYLAYDERLERRVALKALKEAPGAEARQRLQREARAIARLNHANIAALYDVFEYDHEAYLVMEYVDGEPLTSLVRAQSVSVERTLDIGLQLADALSHAHRAGIIHRDVKPANVMVTREGKVKVLDLGVALVGGSDPGAATRSSSEAVPSRAGTPAYMAPERLSGQPTDARSDVYSVGVVLFELLTGARPYAAPDLMTLAVSVAIQPTPRVASMRPDVPPILDDLVARAMAKDPRARFASAAELYDELRRVRDILAGRRSPNDTRRRLVVGLGALAAMAVAAWLMWPLVRRPPAPAPVPPTIAIPPVNNASTGQAELDELGALLQSVLSRNLVALPGLTIVSTPVPSANQGNDAPGPPVPAPGYIVAVTIRRAVSGIAADVDLIRKGDAQPVWHDHVEDDALGVLRLTTEKVASALEGHYAGGRTMTEPNRTRLRQLPTQDGEALSSYLKGRTVLDGSEAAETDQAAADLFESAIKRDGSFAFAHAGLSLAYISRGKNTEEPSWLDRATQVAEQALAIDPACDQALLASALAFRAARKADNAVLEASKAVALTPDSDDARRVLGLALIDQGKSQPGAALAELRRAIALRPSHWINHYSLGRSLLVLHDYQAGIDELQLVKQNLPRFQTTYVNLGFAYMQLGNWDQAVGHLERAVKLNGKDHYALNNLATAYFWDQKYQQALTSYNKALEQDPTNPKLLMNLGDTYQALGQEAGRRKSYRRAVELADDKLAIGLDPLTEAIAAKCLAELGDFEQAENRARSALSQDARNGEVLYKFAVVYALWNKPDKALEKLEQAFKLEYHPVWVRQDPDLKNILNQPRFQALIGQTGR